MLQNPIEVRSTSRPIKVAYLVSTEESPTNHLVLDAVFHESYTRWAGAFTLILPISGLEITDIAFVDWLKFFDPDFVYSYVAITPALVIQIESLCSPISILQHPPANALHDVNWNSFYAKWRRDVQPVSSITTTQSPRLNNNFLGNAQEQKVVVLTTHKGPPHNRFFTDNFGMAFDSNKVTHAMPGLYETLCLTAPELSTREITGSDRCATISEVLSAITNRTARPIAEFSRTHSEAIPVVESNVWSRSFKLFIGDSVLDRINFWNSRHFTPSRSASLGALILTKQFFEDESQVQKLGELLSRTNFLGSRNGQYDVSLLSQSEDDVTLNRVQQKLQAHTYNSVALAKAICATATPSASDLQQGLVQFRDSRTSVLRIAEDANLLSADEPEHFQFIPSRMKDVARGQWIVELEIGRHNNLSRFSNGIDNWILPRRHGVVRAFTQRLGKITHKGRLALLPVFATSNVYDEAVFYPPTYELFLPTDEDFFRHLLLNESRYSHSDVRAAITQQPYADLGISDKGQNLRGIISMLGTLSKSYEILTNRFWREVLRHAKEDSAKHLVLSREALEAFLPSDRITREQLMKSLHLENVGQVTQYMNCNLTDTLEHLVRAKIFYQVHQWRCGHCGHLNSRSFDGMKISGNCEICATEYLAPIDLVWEYQLNDFVHRSLVKHHGLPVLWTLGFLQGSRAKKSFWYLPEVDLYEEHDLPQKKSEIDALCVVDGLFYAIEVKRSASQFLHKPGESTKFLAKMNSLMPDVAMLAFERYCECEDDTTSIKEEMERMESELRAQLPPRILLDIIVASDVSEFNEHSGEVGYVGHRSLNFPTH